MPDQAPWDALAEVRARLTQGLTAIPAARFDAALAAGFTLAETHHHTSEAGHYQRISRYEQAGVSLVEVETYIEREGGLHMRVTLGPVGWEA